ncbi:hypothetical protein TNCV_3078801 [Trichonephila clavipes]|nr:hypothetical protein TNCV_3078801 [Trichonephila clavipes]
MECHSELVEALGNNALPYRTVARWIVKFQQGLCQPVMSNVRDDRSLSGQTWHTQWPISKEHTKLCDTQCSLIGYSKRFALKSKFLSCSVLLPLENPWLMINTLRHKMYQSEAILSEFRRCGKAIRSELLQ